ncbi:MAG TPA: hypothetical protein VMD30_14210, partial [Tepidisphaeraceae bacterium]|nr:hypothetical protein [Tepidisphaeraceae bacterium]
ERAFVVDRVPPDRQGPERAIIALQQLAAGNLSPDQRATRVQEVAQGIASALPDMNDPDILMADAALLVQDGVEPDINSLEFFGEIGSDAIKIRVRPVVQTAVAMYDRAMRLANAAQEDLQNQITSPDSPAVPLWKAADEKFNTAAYTRWMLSYDDALAMDRADLQRKKIAREGIDQLKQWDDPATGVQATVRMQIAKLYMVMGTHDDLKTAQELFRTIYDPSSPNRPTPAPDVYSQFLARYFSVVCTILSGDEAAAQQQEEALNAWRIQNIPDAKGDEYAMYLLDYRRALMNQDQQKSLQVLQDLSNRLQEVVGTPADVQTALALRRRILEQLADKLPPNPDLSKLDPLFLSVVIERGWNESRAAHPDPNILQLALRAADQLLNNPSAQVDPHSIQNALLARGVFLKALGRPYESADAFLNYVTLYKSDPNSQAESALASALEEIQAIPSSNQGHQGPDPAALWHRLLPLAVDDFNWRDLAFAYGRQLEDEHQSAKAVSVFDLVPPDDPNAFLAKYFQMFALDDELDDGSLLPEQRPATVSRIEDLSADISVEAAQKVQEATTREQRLQNQALLLKTKLLTADVLRIYGDDAAQSLQVLSDFEQFLTGLPDARSLLSDALSERVQAYMALGQNDKAADMLVRYLNSTSGNEGSQTVYNLLTRLNKELAAAQADGNQAKVKAIAQRRALLTPYLVQWARHAKGDVHNYVYRYEVFDAATEKLAAELETDPARRTQLLRQTLAVYKNLQSPANFKLYQASLPPDIPPDARGYPDPSVMFGIGEISFDLGDWKTVHDVMGRLLADARLGDGTKLVELPDGQSQLVDNDQFWEGQYDFIQATYEWSKDPTSGVDPQTPVAMLRQLLAGWGDRIGGKQWHSKFADLAAELKVPMPPPSSQSSN